MGITQLILENPAGQISGVLAMLITFYAMSQKDDKKIIKILLLANIFWMIHGIFMGAILITISSIIGVCRSYLSLKYGKDKKIAFLTILTSTIFGALFYENIYSLLPLVAIGLSTYSFFFCEKIKLRLYLLFGSFMYMIYYLHIGSIGGILNEIFISIVLGSIIYRFQFQNISFIEKKLFFFKKRPDWGEMIGFYDLIILSKLAYLKKIYFLFNKNILLKTFNFFSKKIFSFFKRSPKNTLK